ncbi:site-specific DNA-methyltransferase [Paenibacillus kribbensis]|uniref:site-specific DNA-methyltransferase n=1 Tax=Paenibacillus kribbensis TaxID=172713 RepID=UPI000837B214|nr:site-specific DNA-methyltransferase [Paenibacillus kribbensis]
MVKINDYSKLTYVKGNSYGEEDTGNLIIEGENCSILDIISEQFSNKVKCIYIDPPYNNGEKYTHYNDDMKHEMWLEEITKTLEKLNHFLSDDGSIWISIDDSEVHYLKVAADQVFGRKNFITTIVWQQRITRENRKVFSNNHEYILVYAKNPIKFKHSRNLLPPNSEMLSRYKNQGNDPRGPWQSVSAHVQAGHAVKSQFYEIVAPNGRKHSPPNGRCWVYSKERMEQEILSNNIWFGKDGNGVPRIKKFLSSNIGVTPETLWLGNDVGTNEMAKKHLLRLFPGSPVFDTPKPESLIKRILEIATNESDLVLDAYLGSGTTAAVAHKMKRRYIGIEVGKHIQDLVVPRMRKVIEGESGGVSEEVSWQGGGGFSYYVNSENGDVLNIGIIKERKLKYSI